MDDIGANADNFILGASGVEGGMSSIDGIDFQETVFPALADMFFVFERGGNDAGTMQAILADGTLGPASNSPKPTREAPTQRQRSELARLSSLRSSLQTYRSRAFESRHPVTMR